MQPKLLLIAATMSAAVLSPRLHAQLNIVPPEPAVPQKATDAEQWRQIRIKNVSPTLMAYWLDPSHNAVAAPLQFNSAPDVVIKPSPAAKPDWAAGKTEAEIKAMLSLPAGVRAITGVESQNTLWVLGTDAGIQQVVEKVALLDKPLRSIEVEVQIVQISAANVKALGMNFTKLEGTVSLGFPDAIARSQLKTILEQKRAKTLFSPKVTAISGSTASLISTTSVPAVFGVRSDNGVSLRELFDAGPQQKDGPVPSIGTSFGLTVTPTVNIEESINLQFGPLRALVLIDGNTNESITLKDLDKMPTKPITLKSGQTAALQGFTWRLPAQRGLGVLDDPRVPAANVLVLVTARDLSTPAGKAYALENFLRNVTPPEDAKPDYKDDLRRQLEKLR